MCESVSSKCADLKCGLYGICIESLGICVCQVGYTGPT